MPERAYDMSETVHERVGNIEQRLHTAEFQLNKLEEWPPRVVDLERTVQDINNSLIFLQRSQQATQDEMRAGFDAMADEIKTGFREQHEFAASMRGNKSGFARGLQIAIAVITIAAAGSGAVLWYFDNRSEIAATVVGMAAQCEDGTYSVSGSRGACSGHGGVKRWLPR